MNKKWVRYGIYAIFLVSVLVAGVSYSYAENENAASSKASYDELVGQNIELNKKLASLENEYGNLKGMHKLLLEKIKVSLNERKALKKELKEMRSGLLGKDEALQVTRSTLQIREKVITENGKELSTNGEKLKETTGELESTAAALKAAESKLKEAELQSGAKEKELTDQIAALTSENEEWKRENFTLNVEKSEAQGAMSEKLKKHAEELEAARAALRARESKLKEAEPALQAKEKEIEVRLANLIAENEKEKRDNVVLKAAKGKVITRLRAAEAIIKTQEEQLKGPESGREELEAAKKAWDEKLKALETEKKKLAKELKEATGARNSKYKKLELAQKSGDEKLKALETEKKKLAQELAKFAADKMELGNKVQALQAGLKEKEDGLKKEKEALSEEVGKLQSSLSGRITEYNTLLTENKGLKEEVENFTSAKENLEKKMEAAFAELHLKEGELEDEVRELKKATAANGAENDKLKSEKQKLEGKLSAATSGLEASQKKLLSAKESGAAKDENIEELKRRFEDNEKVRSETKKLLEAEKEKAGSLEGQLKAKNAAIEIGKEELAVKKENRKLSEKIAAIKNELSTTSTTLRGKISELKSENAKFAHTAKKATKSEKEAERRETYIREKEKRTNENMTKKVLDMHYHLAVTFDNTGMYEDAEREYLDCLKIAPDDPSVHFNLGILYDDKLNKNAKAITHYTRFLELKPKGDDAVRVKQWMFNAEQEIRIGPTVR